MEAWQIALTVLGSIVGFYLFLIILDSIFLFFFTKKFKQHNSALEIFLKTKYDIIGKLMKIIIDNKVTIDAETMDIYNQIVVNSFCYQESEKCDSSKAALGLCKERITNIIRNNKVFIDNELINDTLLELSELDKNYRTLVALYNADVIGYNYWINFLPVRYIYRLAKAKNKKLIS